VFEGMENLGPTAEIDYPRNLQEFDQWFSDEGACRNYIFRVRWSDKLRHAMVRPLTLAWTIHLKPPVLLIHVTFYVLKSGSKTPLLRVWRLPQPRLVEDE